MNGTRTNLLSQGNAREWIGLHAGRLQRVIAKFSPWFLLAPLFVMSTTVGQLFHRLWPHYSLEFYQPHGKLLLSLAFIAAVTFWVLRGEVFHRWLLFLFAYLLCRSLDMVGSPLTTAVVILWLTGYAAIKYEEMRPYLESRLLISLLVASLICRGVPLLIPNGLWIQLCEFGIWPQRIEITSMLATRLMLLLTVLSSEVMSRMGYITMAEPRITTYLPVEGAAGFAEPCSEAA